MSCALVSVSCLSARSSLISPQFWVSGSLLSRDTRGGLLFIYFERGEGATPLAA